MNWMLNQLARLLADEDGVTAVQWTMIVFLLILVILTGITWLGQTTATSFEAHLP